MSLQSWHETLINDPVGGGLQNNYTTAKNILNGSSLITLPINYWRIGRKVRVRATGGISNIVTTPGLMNFQVVMDAAVVFDTGNIQLNATAHTLLPFWLDIQLTCRSTGGTGTLMGQASITGIMFTLTAGQTDSAQGHQTILVPQTAPAVGGALDTTTAHVMYLFAGFTIANAGNAVQIQQYDVIAEN